MVSKTRDKLIEVARQLFAYKGVENTTMNDIAAASDKGRRTIYTYFKSKREIFNAVVERQSDAIIECLRTVVDASDLSPIEKLSKYLELRFNIIQESAPRPEQRYKVKVLFNRDHRRLTKIFRLALPKERDLFIRMLNQGVEAGVFDGEKCKKLPGIMAMTFSAIDYCHLHDSFENVGTTPEELRQNIVDFVTDCITIKTANNTTIISK